MESGKSKRAERQERRDEKRHSELVQWARSMTDKQLAEFFYEVVAGRRIIGESESYFREHLVLGCAISTKDYGEWEPWKLTVVAPHDPLEYPSGMADSSIICQFGVCGCSYEIESWAKRAICPVCGSELHLT